MDPNNLVHHLVSAVAKQHANRIAVTCDGDQLTYKSLEAGSNRLANCLLNELRVSEETEVVVLMKPGVQHIVALLSIFKSGSIYVPVSADFSEKRFKEIFQSASPKLVVVDEPHYEFIRKMTGKLENVETAFVVIKENLQASIGGRELDMKVYNDSASDVSLRGDSSAYIFYTSGSTGEAKGIMGRHDSLSHFIQWEIGEIKADFNTRVSQIPALTFDASLKDIFTALCSGGCLCIPSQEIKNDARKLVGWIEESKVTVLQCVPSIFRLLIRILKMENRQHAFPNLQYIMLAGETVFAKDVHNWRHVGSEHTQLMNLYGATETTILKTFFRIDTVSENPSAVIPVGKPIPDSTLIIMKDNRICKIGELGEVFLKSRYFTKGYTNKQLNAKSFVQNPFVTDREDLIYKTGDLGRYLKSGDVEVLGRMDNQVKVNGVRVELEEIEGCLLSIAGINAAVAVAQKDGDNLVTLVCYYTGHRYELDVIREMVAKQLNRALIPSYFIHMNEFPLNLNGKVDRKALPKPAEIYLNESDYEPPTGNLEKRLEEIYKSILPVKVISRNKPFFELGGTSLKAMLITAALDRELDVSVKVSDIFENPSVKKLAEFILTSARSAYQAIPPAPIQEYYDLSHAQKRFWFSNKREYNNGNYNIVKAYRIEGVLDTSSFRKAFDIVVRRYEILRTIFPEIDGVPKQKILESWPGDEMLQFIDYSRGGATAAGTDKIIRDVKVTNFDLSRQPPLQIKILLLGDSQAIVICCFHHILFDGWSMDILVETFLKMYKACLHNADVPESFPELQYKDFAIWSNNMANAALAESERYWKNKLSPPIPKLRLSENKSVATTGFNGDTCDLSIDEDLFRSLGAYNASHRITYYMAVLTAIKIFLLRWSGCGDIIVGSPISGRYHKSLENQIGPFLNLLVLRSGLNPSQSIAQAVETVRKVVLDGFAHQDYPYDLLVQQAKGVTRPLLFQVGFTFHENAGTQKQEDVGFEISPYPTENEKHVLTELWFHANIAKEALYLSVDFSTDLFTKAEAEVMLSTVKMILRRMVDNDYVKLEDIDCDSGENAALEVTSVSVDLNLDN